MAKKLPLIGVASGLGGGNQGSVDGPKCLEQADFINALNQAGLATLLPGIVQTKSSANGLEAISHIAEVCGELAALVSDNFNEHGQFCVIGGDHANAVGTWHGLSNAYDHEFGLLWFDAHLDSHTPESSQSKNVHGMPVASLLGHGDDALVNVLQSGPVLRPSQIIIIGARSYESAEVTLLNQLGVKVYFMPDIIERGLQTVVDEACELLLEKVNKIGISIDLDAVDPKDAPGTASLEPDGIAGADLTQCLQTIAARDIVLGAEIMEYNPSLDQNDKTKHLILDSIVSLFAKCN